jgi:uncharacterized protein (TIGR02246 family)
MRLLGTVVATIVAVTSLGCKPGTPEATAEAALAQDRAAIDSVRNQYAATWRTGNAEQLAALYAPDALVLYPNQPAIVGQAAIATYFKGFFDEFAQDLFELTSEEIQVAGTWAFDRGTVRWRGIPRAGGDPVEDNGKYLVILQRQPDGTWRVARDMDNSDRPLTQNTRGAG